MRSLLAQGTIDLSPGNNLAGSVENVTFSEVVGAALNLILVIAAVTFFFMLVIGGVRWIASGGDKGQTENARSQITAALVGLVIVFGAWAITNLLQTFLNIDILGGLNIPTIGGGGTASTPIPTLP